MAGLTDRSLKDSYKNILIIGDSAWNGVTGTLTQIKDGAGVSLPIKAASNKLRMDNGIPIEFGNVYAFVKNDGNKLALGGDKVTTVAVSATTIRATTASLASASLTGNIKAATASFTGAVKAATVSAKTIKTTGTVNAVTISATTIKGSIAPGSGKSISLTGGGKLALADGYDIHNDGDYIALTTDDEINHVFRQTAMIPLKSGMSIGTTASRYGNLFSASAKFKNMYASFIDVLGNTGRVNVSSVSTKKAKANSISVASNIHMKDSASIWLRTDKTVKLKAQSGVMDLLVGAGGMHIAATGIYPEAKDSTFLGTDANTWQQGYIDNVITKQVLSASKLTLWAASGVYAASAIPLSSAAVKAGQIYYQAITGALKIKL